MSTKRPKPQQQQPLTLQQKLQYAEQQRDKYSQIAADPSLSLAGALAARQLARSAGAAATLFQKAQANQDAENQPNADLMRVLGISPSLQGQPPNSAPPSP